MHISIQDMLRYVYVGIKTLERTLIHTKHTHTHTNTRISFIHVGAGVVLW